MELFWVIFWIMLLAIPAIWLVSVLWGIVFYAVVLLISGIVALVQWIIEKVKGE